MSSPAFPQPERRSFFVPILLAVAALAAAVAVAIHFFPATTVSSRHIHTALLPNKTVFKSQSIAIGESSEQTLFVASTIELNNEMRVPIFLDGFTLTFVNPDDAQLVAKALTMDELANAELSFPPLKALATAPLTTEMTIDAGKIAQGTVIFSLPIPKTMWDARKRATVKIDIYHQYPVYQDIPK